MANVKHLKRQPEEVRGWASYYIPHLIRLWERLPEIAAEIDHWDDGEALTYIEEWPLYEDQRGKLNEYADRGILTTSQLVQLDRLNQLAKEHKPIVNHLLGISGASVQ